MKEIIERFGTPLYIFDIDALERRIAYLKKHLGDKLELCYAVKANTFIAKYASKLTSKLEVCSPGEYEICASLGIEPEKMVISGVYKSEDFIDDLMRKTNECTLTIESLNQYELIKHLADKYNRKYKILPRITSGNQFGLRGNEVIKIIDESKENNNLIVSGIEFFSGTQKTSLKKITREIIYLKEFLSSIEAQTGEKLDYLEYGPGFPVEYFEGSELNEEEYLSSFKSLIEEHLSNIKITLELGRSIAASCGVYVTKVVDMKTNDIGSFAIVDGGMNHLVYYGQMMAMKHPFYEIIPHRTGCKTTWNICGSLCTVNDILVKNLEIEDLQLGDYIIFKNTGAYSMCEGISLFLSRDLPKIIIKKGDKILLVRDTFHTSKLNMPNEKE